LGLPVGYFANEKWFLAEETKQTLKELEHKVSQIKQEEDQIQNIKNEMLKALQTERKQLWNSKVLSFHKSLLDLDKQDFLSINSVRTFFRSIINKD